MKAAPAAAKRSPANIRAKSSAATPLVLPSLAQRKICPIRGMKTTLKSSVAADDGKRSLVGGAKKSVRMLSGE